MPMPVLSFRQSDLTTVQGFTNRCQRATQKVILVVVQQGGTGDFQSQHQRVGTGKFRKLRTVRHEATRTCWYHLV